jgi:hypothetical protein
MRDHDLDDLLPETQYDSFAASVQLDIRIWQYPVSFSHT